MQAQTGDDERSDVVKALVSGSRGRLRRGNGKGGLVKNNVVRNEDSLSGEVHASITLMMR
jgi:hypothetical protein